MLEHTTIKTRKYELECSFLLQHLSIFKNQSSLRGHTSWHTTFHTYKILSRHHILFPPKASQEVAAEEVAAEADEDWILTVLLYTESPTQPLTVTPIGQCRQGTLDHRVSHR